VQRLRHTEELKLEAETAKDWHPKRKADKSGASADVYVVSFSLANKPEGKFLQKSNVGLKPIQAVSSYNLF
jgi:hypothetical protein